MNITQSKIRRLDFNRKNREFKNNRNIRAK